MHAMRQFCPARNHQRHLSQGFTAIELMVTIAILAVLTALAAPSFNPIIERYRTRQAAEDLQGTLYFARSEAIKRGGGITITANDGGWGNGWTVNASSVTDPLQNAAAPSRVAITTVGGDTTITADRWGVLTSSGATQFHMQITPQNGTASNGSTLCISSGGLIKRENGATSCS